VLCLGVLFAQDIPRDGSVENKAASHTSALEAEGKTTQGHGYSGERARMLEALELCEEFVTEVRTSFKLEREGGIRYGCNA